ncbi:zinc-finger homeodomain protein 1-like [Zingiber officinale]|nr:zinc-finger homeodomain protein 1-like [Zingiber officinale]
MGGGGESAAATIAMVVGGITTSQQKRGGEGGRYRECLKNHALGIGGQTVDGCGEFMAAGEEGTLDELRCAACGCHRNFHRKEPEGAGIITSGSMEMVMAHHPQLSPYYRTPTGYIPPPHHYAIGTRPPLLGLPSTSGGGGAREEQEGASNPPMLGMEASGSGSRLMRKRFRTKFTQEQKDKMLAFAERVGWRIQKHNEPTVQEFCKDTGIRRHVLKVWMHNNKNTLGKKEIKP